MLKIVIEVDAGHLPSFVTISDLMQDDDLILGSLSVMLCTLLNLHVIIC